MNKDLHFAFCLTPLILSVFAALFMLVCVGTYGGQLDLITVMVDQFFEPVRIFAIVNSVIGVILLAIRPRAIAPYFIISLSAGPQLAWWIIFGT